MTKLLALFLVLVLPAVFAAGVVHAQPTPTLRGEVLEVIDVDSYTYLRLKTASGEIWAAVAKVSAKKGATVTIIDPNVMENFESKQLKRTFPSIVFGTVGVPVPENAGAAPSAPSQAPASAPKPATTSAASPATANAATPAPTGAASAASPHGGQTIGQAHAAIPKATDVAVAKVAKAEGKDGRTVAEVNTQRAALKDKPVAIRATVVKVNANVMGKNWVHVRDGSGSAADGSNDLLLTSKDQPKIGEVVVAKGVVKTDVDLGAGYVFKVLVDDASFRK